MNNLLKVDASVRKLNHQVEGYRSITRQLGEEFIRLWMNKNNAYNVVSRDLALEPPSFITEAWLAAAFTEEQKRTTEQTAELSESNTYFQEVQQADLIVITSPMYNYGMPAALKAWFDQIMRVNKTFSFDLSRGDYPIEPILSGKTVVLLSSCGEFGFSEAEERAHLNYLTGHIQLLSKYLGATDFYEVRSEYQEFADDRHEASLLKAKKDMATVVDKLSSF
ncbi:FMN-dependent NADH-azoreductase [Marinomonas mediterranea]|uniref:FMN-dependent NADH-azoreductase n=1 Tax=Marinomonas mediterranea TaxID=119864 RepID=UPI00234A4DC8|nr:NAD(P)H-dependent oxidoreductase [Marinomonas mediterranea]WCN09572.1 ACP phosphodiesterase [Marinomonas mediterranea]